MRLLTVVGTRPQLIKAAELQPALRAAHQEILVDTGQHWDDVLAGTFFRELGLARPDHVLGAGGGTHAEQLASMLLALEPATASARPDAVIVLGDTNSTLAGGLVAAKLGIPVGHVEAGLRSFDRRMPEEINRVVVDHLSRWLFAPTDTAVANLAAEGIVRDVHLVGDLMQDLAARTLETIRDPTVLHEFAADTSPDRLPLTPGGYLYSTIHRQENRETEALRRWTSLLARLARPERPIVLSLHPGTRQALDRHGLDLGEHVMVTSPLGYRASLALQLHSAAVITDSGGIQREAAWLGVPCLVLRTTTEWVEAVASSAGRMVLVGVDAELATETLDRVAPMAESQIEAQRRAAEASIWSSDTAVRIAEILTASDVGQS